MNQMTARTKGRFELRVRAALEHIEALGCSLAPPVLRIALALPFFRSGLTRWDGLLSISPATLFLFENQFKVHVFGGAYGFPAPDTVALLVAVAEISLPILLVLGFATRFAALALLVMTGVIQLVFPDGWANFHLYWASLAVAIMALGAGPVSVDRLISRRFHSRDL
ncbi:DoxX family protein [Paraburkholderia sp. BL21I4N1]|uniref:DoxX family protein n=1 Tax=Paraburkholderia sp. BL21I4N1 TaxID=1938801 RepID=UPI000CFB5891|nr:DoxX family protein [Paraburkholderia sp. BL21I4N1]PQV54786.1 putative oxidoreductase [Paraburkholderia sp. BL21I4N1]